MASFTALTPISSCVGSTSRYSKLLLIIPHRDTTRSIALRKPLQCVAPSQLSTSTQVIDSTTARRSGNYQPPIWNDDYLQSLSNPYTGDTYRKRAEELKEEVRRMINNVRNPLDQLELIDNLQRLGLACHFETEIKNALNSVYNNSDDKWKKGNLYAVSLEFRLLRQHGYQVSQEIFNDFKDETGSFKLYLCDDIKAMLSFYEASYLAFEGESIMEEARRFTTKHLKNIDKDVDQNLAAEMQRALDLPLHWWPPGVATRLFIDVYERREDKNHLLLELAKLDFNIVQGIYQDDIKNLSRWWKKTGLEEKLKFARSRIVTSFLWGMGMAPERQYSYCREMLTKAVAHITVIDDIYDVYGSLDEILLFTEAFDSWDLKAIEKLPNYMKAAFLPFFNDVNEMAHEILKQQDLDVVRSLSKTWAGSFKAYRQEAKWYHSQYKPSLEEYLSNGWLSITGPTMTIVAYLASANPVSEQELKFIESNPDLLYWMSVVFRLQDDLGTASEEIKRGDVPKAIQCHMHDTGVSEEAAREHIKDLMTQYWKKMNLYKVDADKHLPRAITEMMLNLARTSHFVYLHGDGHGNQDGETGEFMRTLFFTPIPL